MDKVARQFTGGFDISQVNSMAIMSRNISCNITITAPDITAVGKPFQFRSVQGYSKMPVIVDLHSVTDVSGAFDGIVINFNPETVYETATYDTFRDTIGNTLGVLDPTCNRIRPTSFRTGLRMTAETSAGGTTYFRTFQNNFNIKGGRMRLYPFVVGAEADQ